MSIKKGSSKNQPTLEVIILQLLVIIFLIGTGVATALALNEKQQLTAANKATQNWQNKYAAAKAGQDFETSQVSNLENQISSLKQQAQVAVQPTPVYNGPSAQEYCQEMENLQAAIKNSAGILSIAGTCH